MIERRKCPRYQLALPVTAVEPGHPESATSGTTRNISSCGVLFATDADVAAGQRLDYSIELPTGSRKRLVTLKCVGMVVRTEPFPEVIPRYQRLVAATLERYDFVQIPAKKPR